tara:strand:+ start:623 stop:766 length:144 start_codon:yes stop_codon:yes gene_type:complete
MSKFKETLDKLYFTGMIRDSEFEKNSRAQMYDKSSPQKQAALNKHAN